MTESLADRGGWGTRFVAGLSTALATPFIPLWALVLAGHPRWRKDWKGRVGWEVPAVAPGCLWIHGASVGEINAAESLIRAMPGPILLTADTDSGANAARRVAWNAGPRVAAAIRPIDHPWTLAPIWADARPKAVIFVETTFYSVFNLLRSFSLRSPSWSNTTLNI